MKVPGHTCEGQKSISRNWFSLFSVSPPQIFNTQAWHQCSYSLSHLTVPNFTFESESYYVAQVNFEFMNFLPPPPKSGNTGVRCHTQS